MAVRFLPSQIATAAPNDKTPLLYTSSPLGLFWTDIMLFFHLFTSWVYILSPLRVADDNPAKELDELYPTWANLKDLSVHTILIFAHLAFLISIPICFVLLVPALWFVIYVVVVLVVNGAVCNVINGSERFLESRANVELKKEHDSERWIFVNGVSVGKHWLQSNIDRLSYTFGRKIIGVHNPTFGIIFDVIQCLIQRDFAYVTQDIRDAYVEVKSALLADKHKKVVLIVHSQGGIIGSLIVDWLLAELPQDLLQKLEVYTFASASNHFNNPYRGKRGARAAVGTSQSKPDGKAIRYIEHYANSEDFVSRWGRMFERHGGGHMLNQHLLDAMFPLGPDKRALDVCKFMDSEISHEQSPKQREELESSIRSSSGSPFVFDTNSPIEPSHNVVRVRDLSRLWLYRNGASPPDLDIRSATI